MTYYNLYPELSSSIRDLSLQLFSIHRLPDLAFTALLNLPSILVFLVFSSYLSFYGSL